ncbi:MAG: hypothetical protein C0593_08985 [Marinilabiliales bacterium]|nr:MAG: hypothetical protein C0593_08985 [Marinilabiliales bacterium]
MSNYKKKSKEQLVLELEVLRNKCAEQQRTLDEYVDKLALRDDQFFSQEREVFQREDNYKLTLENLQIGLVVHDKHGNVVFCNPQASDILGLTKAQMLGKELIDPSWNFINEDYEVMPIEDYPVSKVISSGKKLESYHLGIRTKDLEGINWVVVNAMPVFFENELDKVIVNFVDITAQKNAEKDIREKTKELISAKEEAETKEKILTAAFQTAMDGIWLVNLNGDFLDVNATYCEMSGYTREELLSMNICDVEALQSKAQIKEKINHIMTVGQQRFESKHFHKDGTIIYVEVGVKFQEVYKGQFVCFIKDITERKKQEAEILESETRFKTLAENIPGTIYLCNNDSTFSMIYLNDLVEELTGYKKVDFLNGSIDFTKLYHNEDSDRIFYDVESALRAKQQFHLQYRLRHKSGKYIWIEEFGSGVFDGDKLLFLEGILFNITDRIQSERELHIAKEKAEKSEARFSFMAQNTLDSIWMMDKELRFTYLSPSTENLFGYSLKEWETLDWNEFVHPEYISVVFDGFNKLTSGEEREMNPVSVPVRHKNGNEMWVEFSVNAIFDESMHFSGAVGITRDISQRRKMELDLAESVERFKVLHNASFGGIVIHDKGLIIECNLGLSEMTGYSYEELIGMDGLLLIAKDKREYVMDKIISGYEKPYEAVGLKKNGVEYPIRLEARNIPYKGKIVRSVEFRDLSSTKKAAEALRKSEAVKNTMVSNIGDVIVIIDENGINRYKSPNITKIFGWDPDELVGKSTWDLVHPDDVEATVKFFDTIASKPNGRGKTELRYKTKDGKYLWIEISVVNLFHDKDINGILGNYHDITERKKVAQELTEAKEKAEESDRLKSAFLANMSHEIRTPMNGIMGFTNLLKEPHLSGDDRDKFIEIIEKSGERMLNTINDIIDISRIEAGQVEVRKQEFSINRLLETLYQFFAQEAKAKNLKMNLICPLSDRDSGIKTDQNKLESILTNLIKNAIKYTEKGSVGIGYSLKAINGIEYLEFFVRDTGIGILEDRIDAIFNRFEQADIEDTSVFEGSGLGLAIAKSYTELLGGKISVFSKEGSGSTFNLLIPYTSQGKGYHDPVENQSRELETKVSDLTVIVAEDDESSRLFFEEILQKMFNKIIYASTGIEAINKFIENPDTDVILMDIKMPVLNGYNATREIRKLNNNVIIIAQTAHGLSGDKEKAIEAGCDDYIAKPIKKENLLNTIHTCLMKKRE